MLKKNYGWIICLSCALLLFCTGGLATTGFSVYQPYLISHFGLSNTQSSTLVVFRNLFSFVSMLGVNQLIGRFNVRRVAFAGILSCMASFVVFGVSSTYYFFCVASALAGIGLGVGGMIPASILITRWFRQSRGFALGVCMAATGFSSMVAPPVVTAIVERSSLHTAFIAESIVVLISAFIFFALTRNDPEDIHTAPIGANASVTETKVYASHDASRKLLFLMVLGIFLFGVPGNLLYAHLSVLHQDAGFTSAEISPILSVFGMSLMIGKCAYGYIADKIGMLRSTCLLYALVLLGTFLCCLVTPQNMMLSYIAVSVLGLGLAVTSVSISMYASAAATERSYSKVVSIFQTASTFGALAFGTVPGIIADITGSYVPAYAFLFGMIVVSGVLLITVYNIMTKADAKNSVRRPAAGHA